MGQNQHGKRLFDTRAYFYRSITQLIIIVGVGLLVKFTLFDFFTVRGEQMSPSVLNGDRVLVFRTPYIFPLNFLVHPGFGKPVVFHRVGTKSKNFLRIAGISGDTVSIENGTFSNSRVASTLFDRKTKEDIVPDSYSPRDFLGKYRIPVRGDSISLDSLSIRDFFFLLSIIRQENPAKSVTLKPAILIDGKQASDYIISGFTLYKGTLETIPEEKKYDWFFWNRLESYLKQTDDEHTFKLVFSILINGSTINHYVVRKSYAFLLADNWNNGLDSRYFGPVETKHILGRAFFVAWSYGKTQSDKAQLRVNRFGRIVK